MKFNKILQRLPVIILGIPLTYVILVRAENYVRLGFLAIVCLLGQLELNGLINKNSNRKPLPEWTAGIALMLITHFYGERALLFSFPLFICAAMIFTVLRGLRGNGIKRFLGICFSIFYLPFCLSCYELLARLMDGQVLFYILASIWALDIGAYVTGMSFKGPKLAPKISPNKTISGAFGGALSCIVFLLILRQTGALILPDLKFWLLALSIATVGQISDLFESILKRECNVKDSGALLGSHGGVLDRIDSVLFLGPISYAILAL
jgi:phosphatidate cytidylyltransferase